MKGYLGVCQNCLLPAFEKPVEGRFLLGDFTVTHTAVALIVWGLGTLQCSCTTELRQIDQWSRVEEWSYRTLYAMAHQTARRFEYTVRHIPSLEKAVPYFELAALKFADQAYRLRRFMKPSRYDRIRNSEEL